MRHQKISCIERAHDFASVYIISLPSVVVLTKNKVVASLHLSCMSVWGILGAHTEPEPSIRLHLNLAARGKSGLTSGDQIYQKDEA
jgi:hypothetical protein